MRKHLLIATAAVALLGGTALAQTQTPAKPAETQAAPSPDQVLATVDGEKITRADLDRAMEGVPAQYRQLPAEMIQPMLLDQIINSKLVAKAGYAAGLQNNDEVKARVKQAEERIVQNFYITGEVEKRITEDAVKTAYEDWKKANPPEPQVHARHILVAEEQKAKDIITQLEKGGDFAKLAQENSTDGAAQQGGDLGFFKKGDMVPEFAEAAFAMEKGAHSKTPVKTQFGWHVIKVEEKKEAEQPKLEEVRPQLVSDLQDKALQDIVQEMRAKAKVEQFGPDGKPLPAEAPKQ